MHISFVIEHMENDDETPNVVPPWVELEYVHMRTLAGPDAHIFFTHLSEPSAESLSTVFQNLNDNTLANTSCHAIGVVDLINQHPDISSKEQVCLLDPKAETGLSPDDGDGRFRWFLFGGILGDDPPRDRTAELRALGFPSRHLGSVQMTTDTAVGVTKKVVNDKVPLEKIPYIDFPTITFNQKESVEMPFRYIVAGGEPLLPPGMRQLLHEDLNKSFDF